jgi:alkaline phosphatase D
VAGCGGTSSRRRTSARRPEADTSPADGFQFFGEVEIDGRTGVLTVTLRGQRGDGRWSTDPAPAAR